jgi:hypothetical protein
MKQTRKSQKLSKTELIKRAKKSNTQIKNGHVLTQIKLEKLSIKW